MSSVQLSTRTCAARYVEPLILVEEISHRVVNEDAHAIAAIRLASAELSSNEARAVLISTAGVLLNYAEAHRALQAPRTDVDCDLGEYLERLCAARSAASLNERDIHLTLSSDIVRLEASRCWRVGLVVSELITNAVKHAFGGRSGAILIEVGSREGLVVCRVSDDGEGNPDAQPALGLSVIKGLAAQLEGEVRWCFEPTGTEAELIFPAGPLGTFA